MASGNGMTTEVSSRRDDWSARHRSAVVVAAGWSRAAGRMGSRGDVLAGAYAGRRGGELRSVPRAVAVPLGPVGR